MAKKSISGKNLEKTITSDDILGKEVIDKEGKIIGVAERILIDPKLLDIVGIGVDKGFLKKGIIIGKSYIKRITTHAIFLSIRAMYEIKGMNVFDISGRKVGIVSSVDLQGYKNKIVALHVKQGLAKKDIIVYPEQIKTIGYNVILNLKKENL